MLCRMNHCAYNPEEIDRQHHQNNVDAEKNQEKRKSNSEWAFERLREEQNENKTYVFNPCGTAGYATAGEMIASIGRPVPVLFRVACQ